MNDNDTLRPAVVDRIENDQAVLYLKDESLPVSISLSDLPAGIQAGDHLQVTLHEGRVLKAILDPEAKANAQQRIQAKLDRLRRGDHLPK